jgi:hypothetical protein
VRWLCPFAESVLGLAVPVVLDEAAAAAMIGA